MTKDTLDDEGQDIGRCAPGAPMTPGYWCLLGFLSVFCAPCLVMWCPLNMCEMAAQHAGLTGGPHSLTNVKKKTTMLPNKRKDGGCAHHDQDGGYGSEGEQQVVTTQPGVLISLPPEEDTDEEDEEHRMMGFEEGPEDRVKIVRVGEHRNNARSRLTPQVQRAQSELVPDRRGGELSMVQRSMSESRG